MLTWIEIDTSAARHNIDAFRGILPAGASLMVVVKANAYGHGLEVFAPIAAERADWLGVNALDDDCFATPAIVDGCIYLRTGHHLYCFAKL